MNFDILETQTTQVLTIDNLLNEYQNKKILHSVLPRLERFPNFVVNLNGMEVMNSVGLNFLLALRAKSVEKGNNLAVVNNSKRIERLFEMTKLRSMFNLAPTVEDAINLFES
jgi:anti-anti-sigma factor